MRVLLALLLGVVACGFDAPAPPSPAPFSQWAAVVVAGDWRAHGGGRTQAFENARRDVAAALLRSGFAPGNVRSYGVDSPARGVGETSEASVAAGLGAATAAAKGGCLVYVTSHGSPEGVGFGRADTLSPQELDAMLDRSCERRPTVVIVSACYSGVYVGALAAPNRMIMTAARPDRTSFGCGENDRYPYFDACLLKAWPAASDFLGLGVATRGCVDRLEAAMKLQPASEPLLWAGAEIRPLLSRLPLSPPG